MNPYPILLLLCVAAAVISECTAFFGIIFFMLLGHYVEDRRIQAIESGTVKPRRKWAFWRKKKAYTPYVRKRDRILAERVKNEPPVRRDFSLVLTDLFEDVPHSPGRFTHERKPAKECTLVNYVPEDGE
jgi:hypothetical protein